MKSIFSTGFILCENARKCFQNVPMKCSDLFIYESMNKSLLFQLLKSSIVSNFNKSLFRGMGIGEFGAMMTQIF